MVDKKPKNVFKNKSKIQGATALDILIIVVVVFTVFGLLAAMLFGADSAGSTNSSTTARSAPVSNTATYAYNQPATTYTQPTYAQPNIQGRAGFSNNSVPSNINTPTTALAGTGALYGATIQNTTQNFAQTQQVQQTQTNGPVGIASNGQLIGLRPIQPLATPYIPTTAVTTAAAVAGRSVATQGSNPISPYAANTGNGNAVINIETVQTYHPQNQELVMNQACVNEVWQRNPYVIRNFSNLSVRLSATNPTVNGNMRTYSFNLDNQPTGNGALCTVTTDGFVTAISFY